MPKLNDLTNQTFGRLTVVSRASDKIRPNGKRVVVWNCSCECGQTVTVEAYSLTSKKTQSCGCYGKEMRRNSNTKHNLSGTRLKRIYYNMLSRCYNPNTKRYEFYGGKNITVCDEWLNKDDGLINFYNWAMNNGYSDSLTLDRIDVNGHYEPNNCRWATYTEQNYNRIVNRLFEVEGKNHTAKEICEIYGININTFWGKIHKGISIESIIK